MSAQDQCAALTVCPSANIFVAEAHGSGDPADYIELYNSGTSDCNLCGWSLASSAGNADLTFGDVTITAGGYWLGYRNGIQDSNGLGDPVSFTSEISDSADQIRLVSADGTAVDWVDLGPTPANNYAQCFTAPGASGSPQRSCYCATTPGVANAECWEDPSIPACTIADLYVSEAHGSGNPVDYIEVTNGGSAACTMNGVRMDDSAAMDDFTFGSNVILPPGGIWFGFKDDAHSFGSGISDSGDEVHLCDTNGDCENVVLASSAYGAHCFDNAGVACYCDQTPGQANGACYAVPEPEPEAVCDPSGLSLPPCASSAIYITEAHGSGDPADYIELYNGGSTDCTLMCWQLDDSPDHADLTFGDVTITAGGYWLGYRNGIQDSNGLGDPVSFTSGISSSAEELHLKASDGTAVDWVDLGPTPANNYAQCWDSTGGVGRYCAPTPGAANGASTGLAVVVATLTVNEIAATSTAVVNAVASAAATDEVVQVSAIATFDTDFATIVQTEFAAAFKVAVAASVGEAFDADDIVVDSIAAGSVVVNWHVVAPATVATEAANLVANAGPVTVAGATAVMSPVSVSVPVVNTPVASPAPPTAPAAASRASSLQTAWHTGKDLNTSFAIQ